MKLDYLSPSKINTYTQCPQKYHFRYEGGEKDNFLVESDNAEVGSAVHRVLDEFNKEYKGKFIQDMPDGQGLIDRFSSRFKEVWKEIGAHNPELVPMGLDILATYAMTFKTRLPANAQILDSENVFELFLENGIPVKGIIDLILKVDNDVWIVDYKTGQYAPSSDDLINDVQMSLYDLVALERYKKASSVIIGIYNIKHGLSVATRSANDRSYFKQFLDSVLYSIESDDKHEARINSLCGWCDYKNSCPSYQSVLSSDSKSILPFKDIPVESEELVRYFAEVKAKIGILEEYEEKLKPIILQIMSDRKQGEIEAPGIGSIRIQQNERTEYSVADIVRFIISRLAPDMKDRLTQLPLESEINRYVKANKKDVDELISVFPELNKSLKRTVSFTTPFPKMYRPKKLLPPTPKKLKARA